MSTFTVSVELIAIVTVSVIIVIGIVIAVVVVVILIIAVTVLNQRSKPKLPPLVTTVTSDDQEMSLVHSDIKKSD